VQYDEPTALLVGDALQSLAFQVLAENKLHVDQSVQLKMVRLLAAASGSRGMAGGQAIDLESVGEVLNLEQLEFMHSHKTGAIIRAACLLGLYCGQTVTPATHASVNEFGRLIGLAFQVVDDVLDAEASTDTLGKTAGKDLEQGKPTYVSAMGLDKSKTLALQLREEAMEILTEFGDRARRLRELADFIVLRKF
ncbi:MAG: polyprenyl synthetase family protein, partial [Betaproteobacteria bacterium]